METLIESSFDCTARHPTHYLAAGPKDDPLLVFVHGWPELSLSWRHQLSIFAGLGFRVLAPDLRGHGQSSIYAAQSAYAQAEVVADMLALLTSQERAHAVWIGVAPRCGTWRVCTLSAAPQWPICVWPTSP